MPVDLIYDIVVERDSQGYGKCIRAPEHVFRKVAGILFKLSTEKPDASGMDDLGGELEVNHATQASFFSFALQCLGDALCGESEGDDDMLLRQNPEDNCILQQFQEDTWVDVFDFGLCFEFWQGTGQQTEDIKDIIGGAAGAAGQLWQDFEDRYTGTSASFDPDLTIEAGNEVTNRAALCAALKEILERHVSASVKQKTENVDGLGRAILAIGAGVALISILGAVLAFPVAFPALAAFLASYTSIGALGIGGAVLGATAAGLGIWQQVVKDTDLSVLNNASARNEILCAWYENLKTETDISAAKFAEELTGLGTDAQALYNVVKALIQIPLQYPAFLVTWKQQIGFAQAGYAMPICECEDTPIIIEPLSGAFAATDIQFIGVNGTNQTVWELTLASSGLNAADAIAIKTSNDGGLRYVKMADTQIVSGTFGPLESQGVVREDTPGHYDPTWENWSWTMYALTFPAKIRLTIEDAGY